MNDCVINKDFIKMLESLACCPVYVVENDFFVTKRWTLVLATDCGNFKYVIDSDIDYYFFTGNQMQLIEKIYKMVSWFASNLL